jgi:hypothetical protein
LLEPLFFEKQLFLTYSTDGSSHFWFNQSRVVDHELPRSGKEPTFPGMDGQSRAPNSAMLPLCGPKKHKPSIGRVNRKKQFILK